MIKQWVFPLPRVSNAWVTVDEPFLFQSITRLPWEAGVKQSMTTPVEGSGPASTINGVFWVGNEPPPKLMNATVPAIRMIMALAYANRYLPFPRLWINLNVQ